MTIIRNTSRDPYFNLASEQYLLDSVENDVFMLWINSPSVIIGRNQNAYSELNTDFVKKNGIKVVRRLTGGGAVFHDDGNVNFTFIEKAGKNTALNFEKYTLPVINALKSLGGSDVCLSGRNDILMNGSKISGNAQTLYNGKTLHHGTLLYSADVGKMAAALKVDPEKMSSKGIKSVKSRVGNVKSMLGLSLSVEEFLSYIENFVAENTDTGIHEFSEEQKKAIQKLADDKYSTWEWNFGTSKEFGFNNGKRFAFGRVDVSVSVDRGVIKDLRISGDFFGENDVAELEKQLVGVRYDKEYIAKVLIGLDVGRYVSGMEPEELASLVTGAK